jgi:hypothetical protein
MMTLIPRGVQIFAGGCRYRESNGTIIEHYCDECNEQGKSCELEVSARELAGISRDARGTTDNAVSYIEARGGID